MWKIESMVFLSFIGFPGIHSFDPKECLLDTAMFAPFITRVLGPNQSGQSVTIATGSIITPDTVLTTCVDVMPHENHLLQCRVIQAHYQKRPVIYEDVFSTAGFSTDIRGCSQVRPVRTKIPHPLCPPIAGLGYLEYERGYLAYNVAVLKVTEVFRNLTEAVPTLPFVPDIATQLALIDKFNSIRTQRGLMPTFEGDANRIQFMEFQAVRSLPLQTECLPLICNAFHGRVRHPDCLASIANQTGYVLCVRRVDQQRLGIMWVDHFHSDIDVSDADRRYNCSLVHYMAGAPVIVRGVAIGIVTHCHWWGLSVSTIYSLRLFLNRIIETGYTEKVIYMDATPPTTKKARSFVQDERRQAGVSYSPSHPVHQWLFYIGPALLAMYVLYSV